MHTIFARGVFYPNIVQEALERQTIVSLVEANLGVSICPASFQKLKIGKVQYRPLADVKTETAISVCFATSNGSKPIRPFLHLVNEDLAAGEGEGKFYEPEANGTIWRLLRRTLVRFVILLSK